MSGLRDLLRTPSPTVSPPTHSLTSSLPHPPTHFGFLLVASVASLFVYLCLLVCLPAACLAGCLTSRLFIFTARSRTRSNAHPYDTRACWHRKHFALASTTSRSGHDITATMPTFFFPQGIDMATIHFIGRLLFSAFPRKWLFNLHPMKHPDYGAVPAR